MSSDRRLLRLGPSRPGPTRAGQPPEGTPPPGAVPLLVACLGFFVATLDVNVVNVALPRIAHDLGGGVAGAQWVVDGYTLPFAALLLSAGAVADRVGASRAFAVGLAAFTVLSAVCGCAPGPGTLIAARAAQGCGAALMLPASLALIRRTYADPAARARGVAWWVAASGVGVAAGPVAGGLLTQGPGWRWVFFLNVPLGVAGLAGLRAVPRSAPRAVPLDPAGQAAAVVASAALVFAMIEGGAHGFGVPEVVVGLGVFAVAGGVFVAVEARGRHAVVPLGLFRTSAVAVCTVTGFALNLAFYGSVFVLGLFFQTQRGDSPMVSGLMFLPMTGLIALVNLLAGRLTARHGPRWPLVGGQLLLVAGLLAVTAVGPGTATAWVLAALLPLGVGAAFCAPALTGAVLEAIAPDRAGLASGIVNSARQLGGAVGVALSGACTGAHALRAGPGFVPGMRWFLVTAACLLVLTATAAATVIRETRATP
ncbi:MFS transporter [Streptomyces sp. ICBB 8177]|uniref:MFS transporter n=1 Tax=Streptomyces sp. ICBB 8177 TaxID=563922 RepID=UPI000D67B73C|nr:MFS transporter [Streptomyces sp. ICBB 8177]PWI45189.1 MFS transporter [Streptomyces sp. ICBB 8177]